MIGKNFENIEIKVKAKDKNESHVNLNGKKVANSSPKVPVNHVSCQRCAEKMT